MRIHIFCVIIMGCVGFWPDLSSVNAEPATRQGLEAMDESTATRALEHHFSFMANARNAKELVEEWPADRAGKAEILQAIEDYMNTASTQFDLIQGNSPSATYFDYGRATGRKYSKWHDQVAPREDAESPADQPTYRQLEHYVRQLQLINAAGDQIGDEHSKFWEIVNHLNLSGDQRDKFDPILKTAGELAKRLDATRKKMESGDSSVATKHIEYELEDQIRSAYWDLRRELSEEQRNKLQAEMDLAVPAPFFAAPPTTQPD